MKSLPILNNLKATQPIFIYKDRVITPAEFKEDVLRVARNLTHHQYAINLCENRYLFAVGFVASVIQNHVCLLPAHTAENEIKNIELEYKDTQRLDDKSLSEFLNSDYSCSPRFTSSLNFPIEIAEDQLVAIVFTSGSSGKPKPNTKTWGALVESAQRVTAQLNLNQPAQHTLVATVPPQHMYGFETTIIFPIVSGVCVYAEKPFFPEDIRQVIQSIQQPVVMVTTPIHLRACSRAQLEWSAIDFVISATAPLPQQLAKQVEEKMQTSVKEIYGCSEAGVIATRCTTENEEWRLLPGYKLQEKVTGTCLSTPFSEEEILLPDQIEQLDPQHFHLHGRQSDLVKIAGKRGSLNDLKIKLCSLMGVDDAVFFMPSENEDEKSRLAAFVVAPGLSIKEIIDYLNQQIDHAFMPRPFIKLDKLPYNDTGKLPRKNLVSILNQYRANKHLKDSA